jgi:hypothetical protein
MGRLKELNILNKIEHKTNTDYNDFDYLEKGMKCYEEQKNAFKLWNLVADCRMLSTY